MHQQLHGQGHYGSLAQTRGTYQPTQIDRNSGIRGIRALMEALLTSQHGPAAADPCWPTAADGGQPLLAQVAL